MPKVVSAVEAGIRLEELLNRLALTREEIVITRAGKRIAKLVSVETGSPTPPLPGKRDFRHSAGLGRESWQAIDVEAFLTQDRGGWG